MAADPLGRVIQLPARAAATAAATAAGAATATAAGAQQGLDAVIRWSENSVDDWGRDARFADRIRSLTGLRWDVVIDGQQQLARTRGALIVVNTRHWSLTPIWTALHLGRDLERPVRFVGRPDTAPVGPALQRLGGLLDNVDEITRVLSAGQLVVLGAAPTLSPLRVGVVPHDLVGAAVAAKVPVFPAATASAAMQRGARVRIGPAVPVNRRRRGPLAELELADALGTALQRMIGEFTWNGWLLS